MVKRNKKTEPVKEELAEPPKEVEVDQPKPMSFEEQVAKSIQILAENQVSQQKSLETMSREIARFEESVIKGGGAGGVGGDLMNNPIVSQAVPLILGALTKYLTGENEGKSNDPMMDMITEEVRQTVSQTVKDAVTAQFSIASSIAKQIREGKQFEIRFKEDDGK